MGGGLECALACDLRIAETQAQMALPEASVGLLPCAGGTQNLPRLVGEGWAKRMILLGERIDAATALRIGLVEEVVATGEAKALAITWAHQAGEAESARGRRVQGLVQATRSSSRAAALRGRARSVRRPVRHRRPGRGRQCLPGKARAAVEERMNMAEGSEAPVLFETREGRDGRRIGIATLNAPKSLNGLSLEMTRLLYAQLQAWADDASVACVVMRGAGDKAFCAGGDLHGLYRSMREYRDSGASDVAANPTPRSSSKKNTGSTTPSIPIPSRSCAGATASSWAAASA